MSVLTKKQIQKLTPEAQVAVASVMLAESKRREQLLETTWRHRGQPWIRALVPALLILVLILWDDWTIPRHDRVLLFMVIIILYGAVQFEAGCINRRFDALLELLDTELRSRKTTDNEKAEPDSPANAG